jgi:hypothetical protein
MPGPLEPLEILVPSELPEPLKAPDILILLEPLEIPPLIELEEAVLPVDA